MLTRRPSPRPTCPIARGCGCGIRRARRGACPRRSLRRSRRLGRLGRSSRFAVRRRAPRSARWRARCPKRFGAAIGSIPSHRSGLGPRPRRPCGWRQGEVACRIPPRMADADRLSLADNRLRVRGGSANRMIHLSAAGGRPCRSTAMRRCGDAATALIVSNAAPPANNRIMQRRILPQFA
jgi:hypothetical protein